ncbi:MAG: sigma-70 family RNA polymerase sigma factor [Phaeodactylibacter sp.]|nr:sigma-70 family RNA polymerase sigma factor [Phaeodactylibacter sp.]
MTQRNNPCNDPVRLAAGIREEAEWACACLYRQHYPGIAAALLGRGASRAEAEEAFQESMVRLLLRVRDGDKAPVDNPGAYLRRTALNLFSRKREQPPTEELPGHEPADEDSLDFGNSAFDWGAFYEAFLGLTKTEQKILLLTFFNQMDDGQVAETMGYTNTGTVKVTRHRAMASLRERLGNNNAE